MWFNFPSLNSSKRISTENILGTLFRLISCDRKLYGFLSGSYCPPDFVSIGETAEVEGTQKSVDSSAWLHYFCPRVIPAMSHWYNFLFVALLHFLSYTDCPSKSQPGGKSAVSTGPILNKTSRKMPHESILYGNTLPKTGHPTQETSFVDILIIFQVNIDYISRT